MASGGVDSHIKVAARLRPLTPGETRTGCLEAVFAHPEQKSIALGGARNEHFVVDYAFAPATSNNVAILVWP